jgi:hypothetical protein
MAQADPSTTGGGTTDRRRTRSQTLTGLAVLCALGAIIVRRSTDSLALHRIAFVVAIVVAVVAIWCAVRRR